MSKKTQEELSATRYARKRKWPPQDMAAKKRNVRHKICPGEKPQKEISATRYVRKKKCPL